MESTIDSYQIELDNKLTEQQQQYEMQINDLLQKISEKENEEPNINTQQFIKYGLTKYHSRVTNKSNPVYTYNARVSDNNGIIHHSKIVYDVNMYYIFN